jgi:hypothetical protein
MHSIQTCILFVNMPHSDFKMKNNNKVVVPLLFFTVYSEKHVPEWNVVTAKIHKGIIGDVEKMSMWQQLADMKKGVMKWMCMTQ